MQKASSSEREEEQYRREGGSHRKGMESVGKCHVEELKMAKPSIGSVAASTGLNTTVERIGEFQTLSTEMIKPVAQSHTKYNGEEVNV